MALCQPKMSEAPYIPYHSCWVSHHLDKWLYVTYLWSQGTKVNSVERQVQIGEKTVIQMFQYLRDVCSTKLLSTPVELGGPGVIVQIDESLFNHKSKYNRGRRASKEQWVFGLADTSSKPAITTWKLLTKEMPQLFYLLYNVL